VPVNSHLEILIGSAMPCQNWAKFHLRIIHKHGINFNMLHFQAKSF